jgi:CheY-like chemotaxis protein
MAVSKTILLIEDDDDDRFILKDLIHRYSSRIRVVEAMDGEQGHTMLLSMKKEEALPDLVILDINLPLLNGWELLEIMRKDDLLSPVNTVVLTTSHSARDMEKAGQYNIKLFSKPGSPNDFAVMMEKLLKQYISL